MLSPNNETGILAVYKIHTNIGNGIYVDLSDPGALSHPFPRAGYAAILVPTATPIPASAGEYSHAPLVLQHIPTMGTKVLHVEILNFGAWLALHKGYQIFWTGALFFV